MQVKDVGNIVLCLGLAITASGLLIQFPITIDTQMEAGRSLPGSIVYFFSFFTILTNLLLVLVYLSQVTTRLKFFARPMTIATAVAAIIVVMIVYHLLLSATHNPVGLESIANLCLHYFSPPLFALWWFLKGRSGNLNWADVPKLLVFPVCYLIYTYVRSPLIGEYPYDFLNFEKNGIAGVSPIIGAIVVLFLILGFIIVFLDKRSRR